MEHAANKLFILKKYLLTTCLASRLPPPSDCCADHPQLIKIQSVIMNRSYLFSRLIVRDATSGRACFIRFKNVHSLEGATIRVKVFELGIALPNSDHAVPTAAVCSVRVVS
jgi:hypothetical protein